VHKFSDTLNLVILYNDEIHINFSDFNKFVNYNAKITKFSVLLNLCTLRVYMLNSEEYM